MSAWMRNQERVRTSAARKRIDSGVAVIVPYGGDGAMVEATSTGRLVDPQETTISDIYIETTDPTGEPAVWFDDAWWMDRMRHCANHTTSIHVLPSRSALLHTVVLHHMNMLARVVPNWRLIGYGWCGELGADRDFETIAASPYHQIRFVEGTRPSYQPRVPESQMLRLEDLFGHVRQHQRRFGRNRPVLIREMELPAVPEESLGKHRVGAADEMFLPKKGATSGASIGPPTGSTVAPQVGQMPSLQR